jgi:hypothetical protein
MNINDISKLEINELEEQISKLTIKYDFFKVEYTNKSTYSLKFAYSFKEEVDKMFTQTKPFEKKKEVLEEALKYLIEYDNLSKEKDWKEADRLEINYTESCLELYFLNNPFLEEDKLLKEQIESMFKRGFNYSVNLEQASAVVLYQLWKKNNIRKITIDEPAIYERYKKQGKFVRVKPCAAEYEGKTFLGFYLGDLPQGITGSFKEDEYKVSYSNNNPYIYIPETSTFVWGYSSCWWNIEKKEDIEEIKDSDIDNLWYVAALKNLAK